MRLSNKTYELPSQESHTISEKQDDNRSLRKLLAFKDEQIAYLVATVDQLEQQLKHAYSLLKKEPGFSTNTMQHSQSQYILPK
jgi:hypothetical protein